MPYDATFHAALFFPRDKQNQIKEEKNKHQQQPQFAQPDSRKFRNSNWNTELRVCAREFVFEFFFFFSVPFRRDPVDVAATAAAYCLLLVLLLSRYNRFIYWIFLRLSLSFLLSFLLRIRRRIRTRKKKSSAQTVWYISIYIYIFIYLDCTHIYAPRRYKPMFFLLSQLHTHTSIHTTMHECLYISFTFYFYLQIFSLSLLLFNRFSSV